MKKIKLILKSTTAALIAMSFAGCANTETDSTLSLLIYQPDYLYLQKGEAIQTQRGIYSPQFDEIWVSEKKYKDALK